MSTACKTPLIPIIDKAIEGDIEETRRLVTDLINQKIDIPGIQEEVELMMFDGFSRFAAAVSWFLGKKKRPENFTNVLLIFFFRIILF